MTWLWPNASDYGFLGNFCALTFMHHQTLEQLEERLSSVLNLIIIGLKVRD